MPELAEIRIMSEYINDVSKGNVFTGIRKAEKCKQSSVNGSPFGLPGLTPGNFFISARSRGKELMLELGHRESWQKRKILMSMGMTGNWHFTKTGEEPKHAQLMFDTQDGMTLSLVDMRRFAKWKYADDWNPKRSPCPVTEHFEFIQHINKALNKNLKTFQKPIFEVMMDQGFFNGIGNYLRAEILYRTRDIINPFQSTESVLKSFPQILDLIPYVVKESYHVGGGELKDWDNPYSRGYGLGRINEKKKKSATPTFRNWLQCYRKMESIKDSKKRTFWFDERFKEDADIYIKTKKAINNEIRTNIQGISK